MKPIVRCLFVVVGMLTAEAAFSQDFKSQAAAVASQWDNAFNSGDASKVAKATPNPPLFFRPGANKLLDSKGPRRCSVALSRAASRVTR